MAPKPLQTATGHEGGNLVRLRPAALALGISVNTLRRRIADGTIPAYRLGPKIILVDLEEARRALTVVPNAGDAA